MGDMVRIPSVDEMDDETLIKHMEKRHDEDISIKFAQEPGRQGQPRRLRAGVTWRVYHNKMHQLYDSRDMYDHVHKDEDVDSDAG